MQVAIFSRKFDEACLAIVAEISLYLKDKGVNVLFFKPLYLMMEESSKVDTGDILLFESYEGIDRFHKDKQIDLFVSIGGDGTLLNGVQFVRDLGIPLVGVNVGRLGFLADIPSDGFSKLWDSFSTGSCNLESRSLIEVSSDSSMSDSFYPYGLNEFTIHKQDSSQMIEVETYVDGHFLALYCANGVLISTPTGSTAYSLSIGGPIVTPNSDSLIINAIAPHQLTARPIVIPLDSHLIFRVSGRGKQCRISIDSHSYVVDMDSHFEVRKAPFSVKMVKLPDYSFYDTLRTKLMWGTDSRKPFLSEIE